MIKSKTNLYFSFISIIIFINIHKYLNLHKHSQFSNMDMNRKIKSRKRSIQHFIEEKENGK